MAAIRFFWHLNDAYPAEEILNEHTSTSCEITHR